MNILLTTDGSDCSKRAARYLAEHVSALADAPEVHVLNVHPPLPYTRAASVLGKKTLEKYYAEEAHKALAVAAKVLDKAGVAYESGFRVGDVVAEIGKYVKKEGIDLVVMGSHGHGALKGLALGSVTSKVLATLGTPVLIVR